MRQLKRAPRRRVEGFTLIELMVALVLSLIVTAAVIAMVIAVIRSNKQTLQSTRLNQELRGTLNLVANDMRRARSVADPLSGYQATTFHDIRNPSNNCINFGFQRPNGVQEWHTLTAVNGRLLMRRQTSRPATVDCSATGAVQLGSPEIIIDRLEFARPGAPADNAVREIVVSLTGHVDSTGPTSSSSRTMAQIVYVRSVGAGI